MNELQLRQQNRGLSETWYWRDQQKYAYGSMHIRHKHSHLFLKFKYEFTNANTWYDYLLIRQGTSKVYSSSRLDHSISKFIKQNGYSVLCYMFTIIIFQTLQVFSIFFCINLFFSKETRPAAIFSLISSNLIFMRIFSYRNCFQTLILEQKQQINPRYPK